MKLLMLMTIFLMAGVAQTLPVYQPAPGSQCSYEIKPDGKLVADCTGGAASDGDYREKWVILCRTKINEVDTTITVDVLNIELQLIDLSLLNTVVATLNPPNPAAGTILFSRWYLPTAWQTAQQFVVTRSTWSALPDDRKWASIKQQPPSQYARLPVSGACAAKILEKLKATADEPY